MGAARAWRSSGTSLASASSLRGVVPVGGWAVDLSSSAGTGVTDVHVYLDGYGIEPGHTFIGKADYGNSRVDVAQQFNDEAGVKRYRNMAAVASWSFNRLFWNENTGCLYDVTNGAPPDPSIRPNQIFAVSLPHTMLSAERSKAASPLF